MMGFASTGDVCDKLSAYAAGANGSICESGNVGVAGTVCVGGEDLNACNQDGS